MSHADGKLTPPTGDEIMFEEFVLGTLDGAARCFRILLGVVAVLALIQLIFSRWFWVPLVVLALIWAMRWKR